MPMMLGTFHQPRKYRNRNFDFVIDRIVIDQKAQLGKHLGDLGVEVGHVFRRLRVVIRNAEQSAVAADVLHELEPLDDFARVGAGRADEQRHALFYRVDARRREGFVFVPMQVVALAEAARHGDHVNTVMDHAIDAGFEVIHVDSVFRIQIARILG
jgi:hypothetical protein